LRTVSADAYNRGLSQPHKVGDKVTFSPVCFTRSVDCCYMPINLNLQGTVIYVNAAHRYYTVEGECNGYKIRESYKY